MFMRTCHQSYPTAIGNSPVVKGTPVAGQRIRESRIT